MNAEKELSLEEVDRLQALSGEWWEAEEEATIGLDWVIETQEKIELEILDIVLGVRE